MKHPSKWEPADDALPPMGHAYTRSRPLAITPCGMDGAPCHLGNQRMMPSHQGEYDYTPPLPSNHATRDGWDT